MQTLWKAKGILVITNVPVSSAGVCQRDVTTHFPGLAEQQDELSEIILEFYEQHIELRFPDSSCKPYLLSTVHCLMPMTSGNGIRCPVCGPMIQLMLWASSA